MADLPTQSVEDHDTGAAAAEPGEAEGLVDLHDDVAGVLVRRVMDIPTPGNKNVINGPNTGDTAVLLDPKHGEIAPQDLPLGQRVHRRQLPPQVLELLKSQLNNRILPNHT